MKNKWFRRLALSMAALMTASALLAGCGESGNAPAQTEETMKEETAAETADTETADTETAETEAPATGVAAVDYSGKSADFTMIPGGSPELGWPVDIWEDTPAIKYWLSQTPSGRPMTVKFNTPPVSAESDYYSTLLATGEYTDFMCATLLPEEPAQLYNEGIIIDLTEYVDAFMPNYKAWMDAHPEYHGQMVATVDGEEKILEIFAVSDQSSNPWEGYMYRRDWLLKYGRNPETGEAFTGGWNADKTEWTDDIVFPSGNTDPIYISDWEWMFDIFLEAIKGEGLEGVAYPFQQIYTGYMSMGNLVTGFGGIAPGVYESRDGEIRCGWTDDEAAMRAYVECMKNWYAKGYMDQTFDEKSGDSIFFMIDQANTYSGHVGMWLGLTSQCGNQMDTGNGDATDGICYFACANPINDVYGDDSAKGKDPWVFFEAGTLLGGSVVVSNKAEDKDLETLFKQIDWLYSPEGAEFATFGLTKEQAEEVGVQDIMEELGLPNGSYTTTTNEDGETVYVNDENVSMENGTAVSMNRFQMGLNIYKNVDNHEGEFMLEQYEKLKRYQGGGSLDYLKNLIDPAKTDEIKLIETNTSTYLSTAIPDFITGRTELNDENWAAFVQAIRDYGMDDVTEMYRSVQ